MHPAFTETSHRPWPLPTSRWRWRQAWCDLLFAHWRVPVARLRPLVPVSLEIEELDGSAWVALVPFRMSAVMRRPFPDLPGFSEFPEINVRTYVRHGDRPGVWFFSLDAGHALAAWGGRRFFHLPYHHARMTLSTRAGHFRIESVRRRDPSACLHATYAPSSPVRRATPGSLEHRLTERYCLYAEAPDRSIWRTEVQHPPWPLQDATAELEREGLLAAVGLDLAHPPDLLHFAKRVDVVAWAPGRVCSAQGPAQE